MIQVMAEHLAGVITCVYFKSIKILKIISEKKEFLSRDWHELTFKPLFRIYCGQWKERARNKAGKLVNYYHDILLRYHNDLD